MYNESQKKDFINQTNATNTTIHFFNSAQKYEEAWGGDFSTMPRAELINMIQQISNSRYHSNSNFLSICKKYITWCLSKNIEGTQDCVLNIHVSDMQNLLRIKNSMIASPKELEQYMNLIFSPESDETVDNIVRCFLWMAFSGIFSIEDTLKIQASNVDMDLEVFTYNEKEYIIYPEAKKTFDFCLSANKFCVKNGALPDRWRDRCPGDLLLRAVAPPKIDNLRRLLVDNSAYAINHGLTTKRLAYKRVWLSGVFYRQYEIEKLGADVEFTDVAVKMIKDSPKYVDDSSISSNLIIRKKRMLTYDYATWKEAFGL